MWCQKCGNEYKEGILICPECNEELVAELLNEKDDFTEVAVIEKDYSDKVLSYLSHLNICYRTEESEIIYDDPETGDTNTKEGIKIFVKKNQAKEAAKEIRTVIKVEVEKKLLEMAETAETIFDDDNENGPGADIEAEEEKPVHKKEYVQAKNRLEDYKSAALMFLVFGIFLIVFSVLNMINVIKFIGSLYSQILLIAMGLACMAVSLSSKKKLKDIKSDVEKESIEETNLKNWLSENFPKEKIDSIADGDVPMELLYMKQTDTIKEELMKAYPETEPEHADILIEEYYNSIYGTYTEEEPEEQ